MNTEEQKDLQSLDQNRLAYMVAWRDRYIEKLEERLKGHEEENAMLQTLLFYALVTVGRPGDAGELQIPVSKRAVAETLGKWQCDTTDGGDDYLVTFTPVKEAVEAGETRGDEEEKE